MTTTITSPPILAWHFIRENRKLGYSDGREVEAGETYTCERPDEIELCEWGMHGSEHALDALRYAPGAVICRVELAGTIIRGDDKVVATHRKVLWLLDATPLLYEFACIVAGNALELAGDPDPRSIAAIAAKRAWLAGKASNSELESAESAAWSATEFAAWSAANAWSDANARSAVSARSAARSAAWSAARSAAESAATRSAARSAVESAWSAAESTAWSTTRSASWSAAWSAARSATVAEQNELLEQMLLLTASEDQ